MTLSILSKNSKKIGREGLTDFFHLIIFLKSEKIIMRT